MKTIYLLFDLDDISCHLYPLEIPKDILVVYCFISLNNVFYMDIDSNYLDQIDLVLLNESTSTDYSKVMYKIDDYILEHYYLEINDYLWPLKNEDDDLHTSSIHHYDGDSELCLRINIY